MVGSLNGFDSRPEIPIYRKSRNLIEQFDRGTINRKSTIDSSIGERQIGNYLRMGPMSRPSIGSGQWSQTTTGIFHSAARPNMQRGRVWTASLFFVLFISFVVLILLVATYDLLLS